MRRRTRVRNLRDLLASGVTVEDTPAGRHTPSSARRPDRAA
ncbi:hypothetical protein [Streptomyces endophytica]|uniref:Uncharacterized protein n=1 Tax=Streptomyces endophytica TaxID=2991496 RepID=A0ABY6P6W1_9ACTN|nr:hypothetical protein [Streptomyces endophytica]UZJ29533.1 hypothetical protein OJ254_02390 [Streptomyces endophytica]